MEYTALWGPKGFIVSPTKIVPLLNLTTTFAVKSENGNSTGGSSTTNTRGRELQAVSLSTLYVRAAGVDPRGQIAEWEALVGEAHPLYIAGDRFGPNKLMLKSVDVSDVLLSNTGKFLQVAIALKFEEYSDGKTTTTKSTKSTTSTSNSKSAQVYNATVAQKKTALNATAKPLDRASKKPSVKAVSLK